MATASASGIMLKAMKLQLIDTNCSIARETCQPSRRVRSTRRPPLIDTSTKQGMSAKRQRMKTTSPTG